MRSFTLLLLCALCADAGAQAMDPRRDPGLTRPSRPTLWPALQVEDYPEEADSVRVVARSVGSGRASYDLFHVRGRSTGFASRIEATLGVDARGLRTLTLRQQDDHCLELAATLRVEPGSVCAQLVATLLMPGAVQLSYLHPMLGHQLQFVLAQQRTDPASWQLVRSGRIGEPATRMTTCPRFPDPLFHGINYDAASNQDYMSYDFFRVLMRNAATPMVPPSFWEVQEPVSHMAQVLLVRRRDPANWVCGQNEFRIEDRSSVPVGDWVRRATGDCEVACSPPQRGLYELMYRLDPYSYWYEGAAGEANNEGYFRGEHIER